MMSRAEQDWAIFRKYKFRGVRIEESTDHIRFSQLNSLKRKYLFPLIFAMFGVWLLPTLAFSIFLEGEARWWGPTYFFVSMIPLLAIYGIGYLFLRRRTYVDIYPTHMQVRNGTQNATLTFDQIRNIDVHQSGPYFDVLIWHGPVALYTVTLIDQQSATSFREAMRCAIEMLSERATKQAAPARRSFAE